VFEPLLVCGYTASGELYGLFPLALEEGVEDAAVALICVGTPSERSGDLGLGQLHQVCEELAAQVRRRPRPLVVAVRRVADLYAPLGVEAYLVSLRTAEMIK
jgi:hypothetical protein